jgi:hypothetical protein
VSVNAAKTKVVVVDLLGRSAALVAAQRRGSFMRHVARFLFLAPVICIFVFVPSAAQADKKADEESAKINPPVPYKLFVAASPHKFGAERIRNVFAEKNSTKKWRPTFDQWFVLVPERDKAEMTLDVSDAGFDKKPGYETVYYISGRLTITGMVKDSPIRGDNTPSLLGGPEENLDLLRRIIHYMREHHRDAVLAHTGGAPHARLESIRSEVSGG